MNIPDPSDIHASALRAIPGYATATERIERLSQWDNRAVRAIHEQLATETQNLRDAVRAAADGQDVDVTAIARRIHELHTETEIAGRVAAAVDGIRSAIRTETRGLTDPEKDHALAYLNDIIRAVADETRDLDTILGGVASSSAAFRGTPEQLTAWQRLDQLVDTYDAIRNTQRTILGMTTGGGPVVLGKLYSVGLLADALDRDRLWIARRMTVVRQNFPVNDAHQPYAQWMASEDLDRQAPIERGDETHWPTPDRHEYLRWISVNATPWVPTTGQLDQAAATANLAMQVPGLKHAHDYWQATGAAPVRPLPPRPIERDRATTVEVWTASRGGALPERVFGS